MKTTDIAGMLLLFLPVSAIASHACLISYDNSKIQDGAYIGELYIRCDKGNPDTKTILKKTKNENESITLQDIATALAGLAGKDYKVTSQSNEIWTLVKE